MLYYSHKHDEQFDELLEWAKRVFEKTSVLLGDFFRNFRQKEGGVARYEHLKVFKATYDFNIYFYQISRGFPKEYKYGLADEIRKGLTYVLTQIMLGNSSKNKTQFIVRSIATLDVINIKVRMLHDLKVIKVNRYKYIAGQIVEISSQLTAWKSWLENGRR